MIRRFLDSRSFGLSIVLLLGILGLVLALGWVNISSAYENPLEGEIDISFVNSHDRPAVRLVVQGNHTFIKYYRGEIIDGEKTICNPVRKARFDLVPGTGHDTDGTILFHEYTENDKTFHLDNDNYDYVCFLIGWGIWDGDHFAESYGPYRMGSDVTADNYDDLLEQTEEEETTPDNPPVLAIQHNNTALSVTATDDNLNSDSWQNAGPFAAEPNCESGDLTYSPAGSDQHSLTLTTADNDQWYCFKVSDTGNNIGYMKYQVTGVVVEEEDDNNENDPDRDDTDNQEEDNNNRDNSNNGGSVVRQDTGSGGSGNGNPQQSSRGATATPAESVSTSSIGGGGDQADIPNTGITDKQGWLQLVGVAIILVAILGYARILIMKKRHQRV